MKKLVLGFILFFISSNIIAQIPVVAGTYTIGGDISYNNYSEDGESNSSDYFHFSPNIGYFFINKVYTALFISYAYQSSGDYSANTFGIGPALRYYINTEKLNPFLGFSYLYNSTINHNDYENDYTSFTSTFGVDYFVTNYFAIEGSINYSFNSRGSYSTGFSNKSGSKTFNIGFGANYFIQ